MTGPISGLIEKRTLRRWRKAADAVDGLNVQELKRLRGSARSLSRQVDRVLHGVDGRLSLPFGGKAAIRKPIQSDWAWRPGLWSGPVKPIGLATVQTKTKLGDEAKVFHDCARSELSIRQVRNQRAADIAPFGIRMDVFQFDGSFLSLVLEMPEGGIDGLCKRHLIRLAIRVETEKPLEIFGRLNVRHGPNVEQLVREFDGSSGEFEVEFDLSTTRMNEARVDRAWADLIFEGPDMNEIVLRDVTFSRRPRAEF